MPQDGLCQHTAGSMDGDSILIFEGARCLYTVPAAWTARRGRA